MSSWLSMSAGRRASWTSADVSGRSVRVVLIGSAAEYGNVEADKVPVEETISPRPVSLYGIAKAAQTLVALRPGYDAVVARVFNVCGPGEPPSLVCGAFASQILTSSEPGMAAQSAWAISALSETSSMYVTLPALSWKLPSAVNQARCTTSALESLLRFAMCCCCFVRRPRCRSSRVSTQGGQHARTSLEWLVLPRSSRRSVAGRR